MGKKVTQNTKIPCAAHVAEYGAVGASMLTPWANLVVMAARSGEV